MTFDIPNAAYDHFRAHEGAAKRAAWEERVATHPRGKEYLRWLNGDLEDLVSKIQWPTFTEGESLATRKASAACLKAMIQEILT